MMEAKFFDKEYELEVLNGKKEKRTELFFSLKKASTADTNAQPFEFEDVATEKHKKDYPVEYARYLKSKEVSEKKTEEVLEKKKK